MSGKCQGSIVWKHWNPCWLFLEKHRIYPALSFKTWSGTFQPVSLTDVDWWLKYLLVIFLVPLWFCACYTFSFTLLTMIAHVIFSPRVIGCVRDVHYLVNNSLSHIYWHFSLYHQWVSVISLSEMSVLCQLFMQTLIQRFQSIALSVVNIALHNQFYKWGH